MPKTASTLKPAPTIKPVQKQKQAPATKTKTIDRSKMTKEQIDAAQRLEKIERELKIAKMCLAEDVEKLKEAKQEYNDCIKAAARLHIVKKNINKLQMSEYDWVKRISKIEEELKIYKR
jgi:uncharacterized protein (DUF111 family)